MRNLAIDKISASCSSRTFPSTSQSYVAALSIFLYLCQFKFLDEVFTSLGYANGFADANASTFYSVTIPNGKTGNMGYTKRHRMKYVQLNARNGRDLEAFQVSAINGCDVYFMKTCGNLFFFQQ